MGRNPHSASAAPSLMHRLQWHTAQSLRRGIPCSVLVLQPLGLEDQRVARALAPEAAGTDAPPSPLGEVASRLRPLLRQMDVVEVEEGVAVGVLLPGADADGVRAVHQRLCHMLEESARAPHVGGGPSALRLAVGHASAIAVEGVPIPVIAREIVCVAYVPRLMLAVPLTAARRTLPAIGSLRSPKIAAGDRRPARRAGARARLRLLPAEVGIGAAAEARESLRRHADALRVPFVSLPPHLPRSLRRLISGQLACELRAVPIGRTRGVLTVAMQDPTNIAAMQRLAAATGLTIFPVLAAESELDRALDQLASELTICARAPDLTMV